MTQTNSASTIQFIGPMAEGIMWDEPEMVRYLQRHALDMKNIVARVYVAERNEETEALHWQVTITSAQGRQSYVAVQRRVGSSIYVTKD